MASSSPVSRRFRNCVTAIISLFAARSQSTQRSRRDGPGELTIDKAIMRKPGVPAPPQLQAPGLVTRRELRMAQAAVKFGEFCIETRYFRRIQQDGVRFIRPGQ